MSDSFSSFCIDLIIAMIPIFHKYRMPLSLPDYAITIPFDLKKLSRLSRLRARVLRQTKRRWCWFEKARKDDKEASTRLGTLRYLPYEVRQQIFKIALEHYYEDYNRLDGQEGISSAGERCCFWGSLTKWQLVYEGRWCRCEPSKGTETWDVFDLESYSHFHQSLERAPLSLRFASPSVRPEFERVFLTSNTFDFICPASLERFLDQLSPYQQRQLKSVTLRIFNYSSCFPDPVKLCGHWMALCQRLPSELRSVEFDLSPRWGRLREFWMNTRPLRRLSEAKAISLAANVFGVLSKQVSRASSRSKISMTGRKELCKEDCNALDAVLHELEPWSKGWHEWKDGGVQIGGTEDMRNRDWSDR